MTIIKPPTVIPKTEKVSKPPIRLSLTKKGDKLTMYVTLPMVQSGMNIQHRWIPEIAALAADKAKWDRQFGVLRTQVLDFIKQSDTEQTLKAWY